MPNPHGSLVITSFRRGHSTMVNLSPVELMTASELIGVLGGVVGLVGGLAGILSAFYQRTQTQLMREQIKGLRDRDTSYAEWTAKWEEAADVLVKIYPGYVIVKPGTSTNAYELVFSEPLRRRIEHHLGKKIFFTNKFHPKVLLKDDLLNSVVQEVITEVLAAVEKFKREHTDWSRSLRLL